MLLSLATCISKGSREGQKLLRPPTLLATPPPQLILVRLCNATCRFDFRQLQLISRHIASVVGRTCDYVPAHRLHRAAQRTGDHRGCASRRGFPPPPAARSLHEKHSIMQLVVLVAQSCWLSFVVVSVFHGFIAPAGSANALYVRRRNWTNQTRGGTAVRTWSTGRICFWLEGYFLPLTALRGGSGVREFIRFELSSDYPSLPAALPHSIY